MSYGRAYYANWYDRRQAEIRGEIERLIQARGLQTMTDEQWRVHLQNRARLAEIEARKESFV